MRKFYIVSEKSFIFYFSFNKRSKEKNEKGVQSPVHKRALQRAVRARQVYRETEHENRGILDEFRQTSQGERDL